MRMKVLAFLAITAIILSLCAACTAIQKQAASPEATADTGEAAAAPAQAQDTDTPPAMDSTDASPEIAASAGTCPAAITEDEAIDLLMRKLGDERLCYMPLGIESIMGRKAYSIRAYYDHAEYIETYGFYYVMTDTGEIYQWDLAASPDEDVYIPVE